MKTFCLLAAPICIALAGAIGAYGELAHHHRLALILGSIFLVTALAASIGALVLDQIEQAAATLRGIAEAHRCGP